MVITWLGLSCFKIQAKTGDKEAVILTDPFDNSAGIRLPRSIAADLVTVSHKHGLHSNAADVAPLGDRKKPFILDIPGEYEIGNVFVYGISSVHDDKEGKARGKNIIYRIEAEGISLVHLGDLGRELTQAEMEKLENVDILLIPAGGSTALPIKKMVEVVAALEPRVVIPMHYKLPDVKLPLEPLDKFLRELGAGKQEPQSKLKISKKDLPSEDMKVVVLERG
ncbi:MBL fold metallo-hydrolase [Candidatus Uhrbacteria bacterium]|nr:MBL fold metallo-hydrolase [Candidatus Uhrbacteria bacterium]